MSYIKLDRKLLNWEWKDCPEMIALWIDILLEANYSQRNWRGNEYEVGTFPTSVERLSINTGISVRTVRTCLERLKKTGEIDIQTTNKGTKIIVKKWAFYQGMEDDECEKPTNDRQTTDKQLTTLKERKESKEGKEYISKGIDCSPEFSEALDAFEEMRKKIKKPLTNRAKQMVLTKLGKLAADENTQIEILNQSTMNGWQDVYPLKDTQTKQKGMVNVLDL